MDDDLIWVYEWPGDFEVFKIMTFWKIMNFEVFANWKYEKYRSEITGSI